jgi:hypothetical protein
MTAYDRGHGTNDGTHRRLNRSLAWCAVEEKKLAEQPDCEECGAVAVEAHHRDGCTLGAEPEYLLEHAQSLCERCHDAVCPTRARTREDARIDRMLNR